MLRFSVPVLLATSVFMSGCKKTDKAPAAEPAASGGSAASGTQTPAPPAAQTPPVPQTAPTPPTPQAAGNTGIVPSATLEAIALPAPRGAPAKGMWSAATAGDDGERMANFVDGNDYWVSVELLDCNLPRVKDSAGKPGGEYTFCFDKASATLKGYPLFKTSDSQRVVKVGHLAILASLGVAGEAKLTAADLEAFLESLDLASLAKL